MRNCDTIIKAGAALVVASAILAGCSGESEPAFLMDRGPASESDCEYGGTTVHVGIDEDGSGQLSEEQISGEYHICDGPAGTHGDDADPTPLPIVEVYDEAPGENCEIGGKRVVSGVDDDHTGELSESQIDSVQYLCNTSCAGGPPLQFDIDMAHFPPTFHDDFPYAIPVTTDADEVAISAVSATSLSGMDPAPELVIDYDDAESELSVVLENGVDNMEYLLYATDGCRTTVASFPIGATSDDGTSEIQFVNLISDIDVVDLKFYLSDSSLTLLPIYSEAETVLLDWGDYTFDVFDDDFPMGTLPEFFLEPGTPYLAYLHEDDGDYLVGQEPIPSPILAPGQAAVRVMHAASGVGDIEAIIAFDGGSVSVADDLEFEGVYELRTIAADASAHLEIERGDNQETLVYSSTEGVFADGAYTDLLVTDIEDTVAVLIIDQNSGDWQHHLPDEASEEVSVASDVLTAIPANDSSGVLDTVTVDDCDYVGAIDVDVNITHPQTADLIVRLSSPDNDHYYLWYRTNAGGDLVGNFNDTFWPPPGYFATEAFPANVFIGSQGTGEWDLFVSDEVAGSSGTFHDWQLNLTCL